MDPQPRPDTAAGSADTASPPVSRTCPWNAVNRPVYYDATFWVLCAVALMFLCFPAYRAQIRILAFLSLLSYVVYLVVQAVKERQYRKNRARWARLADEEAAARESRKA